MTTRTSTMFLHRTKGPTRRYFVPAYDMPTCAPTKTVRQQTETPALSPHTHPLTHPEQRVSPSETASAGASYTHPDRATLRYATRRSATSHHAAPRYTTRYHTGATGRKKRTASTERGRAAGVAIVDLIHLQNVKAGSFSTYALTRTALIQKRRGARNLTPPAFVLPPIWELCGGTRTPSTTDKQQKHCIHCTSNE